jgi:alpha-tubulin suppressor-like RCC1 family protein
MASVRPSGWGRSWLARGGWGAVIAAVAVTAGCSPAQRPAQGPVSRPTTSALYHWGSLFGGPHGNFDTHTSPTRVLVPGAVAQVGTSNSTQYALLTDGRLYAWGLGTDGQLGDGRRVNSFTRPVLVRFPRGVKIAWIPTDVMPYDTALAVDTEGRAWGWGRNGGGELCLGSKTTYLRPVRLPLPHVTAMAGASNHAVYDAAGTVYACGQNVTGDLGDGSLRSSTRPARVAGLPDVRVAKLVASFANSGALLADGRYFDWGYNRQGQLGDGHAGGPSDVPVQVRLPHPVTQVAQGGSLWGNGQTLALLSDGTLRAWGDDRAYQLGNGATGMQPSPVRIRPPAGVTYRSLATGSATSYAVSTAGQVYAWGVSHVGQVGDGHTSTARAVVLVASGATLISATANNVVISVPGP